MTDTSALEPAEYLRRLFDDLEFSYLVVVAAQLGVADLLASGARSIADLSAATGVDAQSLYRVLRALSSRGLFRDDGDKRFSLTPLAEPLRQDAAHSIVLRHCGAAVRPTGVPGVTWRTACEPVSLPSLISMANRSLTTLPRIEHLRRSSTT